jgi:hypothetical protein
MRWQGSSITTGQGSESFSDLDAESVGSTPRILNGAPSRVAARTLSSVRSVSDCWASRCATNVDERARLVSLTDRTTAG